MHQILKMILAAGLTCVAMASWAQQSVTGQTQGGANYQFSVPDGWTPADGLLIWNHGFDYSPLETEPDLGPLSAVALNEGLAVAASSYSLYGWALFNTTRDLREMVREFEQQFAVPDQVYVAGGSMGGLVTSQIIEQGGIGNVVGALPLCGVTGGSQVWNAALDLRLLYDQVCAGVLGAQIPGGPFGYSFALSPTTDGLNNLVTTTIGVAVQACTGLATPGFRTPGQQERLDTLLSTARTTEQWLPLNLAYATLVLADLTRNPDKLDGGLGLSNVGVDYGDAQINAEIERSDADPVARLQLAQSYSPRGLVGDTKIVALHTDKDGLVVLGNLTDYVSRVPTDRLTAAVVVEDEPSHCGFAEAEIASAWQALRNWTDGDPQPTAASLQTDCELIAQAGNFAGPCRIDPNFVPSPLADTLRARPSPGFSVDSDISGIWYDPDRNGEGWLIEMIDSERAVVYWFTYPASDEPGQQIWMNGLGRVDGNQVELDTLEITAGARFGPAFDGKDLQRRDWGRLVLAFDDCDNGAIHSSGPLGYNQHTYRLQRLSSLAGGGCGETRVAGSAGLSGSWFVPSRDGEGWIVQMLENDRASVYWFTYDPEGNQAWVFGIGDWDGATITIDQALITGGTQFGDNFSASRVATDSWGSFSLSFSDCDNATVSYDSAIGAYGSGSYSAVRLTAHAAADCAL